MVSRCAQEAPYLVESVGRVDGVEFFGRVLSGILQDDFLSTRTGIVSYGPLSGERGTYCSGRNSVTS
jgi:hypothetical protein